MVEVLAAGFLHQEASLLVQPVVEVKHSRFYCYGSESGDSDKSICSSVTEGEALLDRILENTPPLDTTTN